MKINKNKIPNIPLKTILISTGTRINPEDVLVAEATETLELAEDQLREGMNQAAARNFHTATIYFRVLESLVPSLTMEIHAKLEYAAMRSD